MSTINFTVKTLDGKVFKLENENVDSTIFDIKKKLAENKEEWDAEYIKLVFGGKILNNNETLKSYDIENEYQLIMIAKNKPKSKQEDEKKEQQNEYNGEDNTQWWPGQATEEINPNEFINMMQRMVDPSDRGENNENRREELITRMRNQLTPNLTQQLKLSEEDENNVTLIMTVTNASRGIALQYYMMNKNTNEAINIILNSNEEN